MIISSHDGTEIHRTYALEARIMCMWEVNEGGVPRICFMRDNARRLPPIIWPDIPLTGHATGTIAFDAYPTLAAAMELLPEYTETLWEAIRREFTRSGERYQTPPEALAWAPNETSLPAPAYIDHRRRA